PGPRVQARPPERGVWGSAPSRKARIPGSAGPSAPTGTWGLGLGPQEKRRDPPARAFRGQRDPRIERVKGIEPSLSAGEADVLPLNYPRERRLLYRIHGRRARMILSWLWEGRRRGLPDGAGRRGEGVVVHQHDHLKRQLVQPPVDPRSGTHGGGQ